MKDLDKRAAYLQALGSESRMRSDSKSDLQGYVRWAVQITGARLPGMLVEAELGRTRGVQIISGSDDTYEMRVLVAGIYDQAEALSESRRSLDRVLDEIALLFDAAIAAPRHIGQKLPYPPGSAKAGRFVNFVEAEILCVSARSVRVVSENEFRQALISPATLESTPGRSTFRVAMSQQDPIAKYTLLYNAILEVCGDSQTQVDALLRRLDPALTMTTSPRGINETVYTRLRNELAHHRPGVTLENTTVEIKANLSSFVIYVRSAILEARAKRLNHANVSLPNE